MDVFSGVNKTVCTLYVPKGSKSFYKVANQWKDFQNIIEMTTEIKSIGQSNINLIVKDRNLVISNVWTRTKVEIYSLSGVKMREEFIDADQTIMSLPTGIYVIFIGGYSDKIVVQ